MVINPKGTGKAMSIPMGLAMGLGLGLVITLLGTALIAWMVLKEWIPESSMGIAALAVQLLASAAGAWLAMAKIKRRKLQVCMLCGLCYYLLLLATTALLFDCTYQGMGSAAVGVFVGSAAVALLGARGEKGRHTHKRKMAYR